jgi:hypothetical protein
MRHTPRGAISGRSTVLLIVAGLAGLGLLIASFNTCLRVGLSKGLWLDECPDGELRQIVELTASDLKRGAPGVVEVTTTATYVVAPYDRRESELISRFTPQLSLVTPTGEVALTPKAGWKAASAGLRGEIELPKLNDGEYTLRAKVTSPIGETVVDVPLPLFTPARVHVLTDRPLYEPGNTVRFRALALKASDLTPLEERPGVWRVTDPSGEVLLEEKAPSGAWGVVSGSFPLDRGAESGTWTVTWASGGQAESRTFEVRPFTLPRFRVEAAPDKPFYRRGERPRLKGSVTYSSGAPVANAKLELSWRIDGEWPAPTSWTDGSGLPKAATTTTNGSFTLELPQVPQDLRGQATLAARLAALDAAGDRVEGTTAILLSEDLIAVDAVTEFQGGLVEGLNNRVFLRATTADGRLLEGATLNVKRLWEPSDPGTDAEADEDGVASLQLDPGPPVNVVIPAMPFRPPPRARAVTRVGLDERLGLSDDGDVSLADRMAFDRLEPRLEACARYVDGEHGELKASLLVRASGAVSAVTTPPTRAGRCLEAAMKSLSFSPGKERFFDATWLLSDEELPRFEVHVEGAPEAPDSLSDRLADALLDARDCLPATVRSGELPRLLHWRVGPERQRVELSWVPIAGDAFGEGVLTCISSRVKDFALPVDPDEAGVPREEREALIGVARVSVSAPEKYEASRPQDTVMEGYEFLVTARRRGESLGSTRLRLRPGQVPDIRLRASKQLVTPGEQVTIEVLRGPDFTGTLPEKLFLTRAFESIEAKLDEKTRTATFTIPPGWEGWAQAQWGGGQVFLFVQALRPLAVKVTPERPRYAPGQVARLELETTLGGQGAPAGVGLFGVDESLSQLTSLPGADELAGLRPQAVGDRAFGVLDAQALSLGRVRGRNAAAATLLRVSSLPPAPSREAAVSVSGRSTFDPNEAQVDRFYAVLGQLYEQVRAWEKSAPPSEQMTPATMARLWNQALDAVEARHESARDGWGRRLRLHRLPADLLALTEPRLVVINGTRLPEDMQNWPQWVAKEKP